MPARRPPQLTAPGPASTTAAPTRPLTRVATEGSPHRQVTRFQITAAVRAAPTTITVCAGAVHDAGDRVGHRRPQQQRAEQVADRGQEDRRSRAGASVATSVAMALAASWKPLQNANAKMATMASTNAASTAPPTLPPRLARIIAPAGVARRKPIGGHVQDCRPFAGQPLPASVAASSVSPRRRWRPLPLS